MKKILILLICSLIVQVAFSQKKKLDSLWRVMKNVKTNIEKTRLYYDISRQYENADPDSALFFCNKSVLLLQFLGGVTTIDQKDASTWLLRANALQYSGLLNRKYKGQCDTAIVLFNEALKIFLELSKNPDNKILSKALNGAANCYNSIANAMQAQGKFPEALIYYHNNALGYAKKSLQIARDIGALPDENTSYQHLKEAYAKLGDYKKALEYYNLYTITKDSLLNNEKNRQLTEMEAKYQSEKKQQQIKIRDVEITRQKTQKYAFIAGLIFVLALAIVALRAYIQKGKTNRLLHEKNTEISQQKEEIQTQAEQLERTNKELEKFSIVANESDNSVVIADKDGELEWANMGFIKLFGYTLEMFKEKHGSNLAGSNTNPQIKEMIRLCKEKKQSVIYINQATMRLGKKKWVQTTLTPILDETERLKNLVAIESDITKIKETEEKIEAEKKKIQEKNKKLWEISLLIHKEREKTQELLKIVEEKNNDISDSIHYALRIQQAILPDLNFVRKIFPETFILYKPKDVVSGDFYWWAEVENKLAITVGDCTGHGVPGAFMSMLGISFLREIVQKEFITDPSVILRKLRKEIINALKQKGVEGEQQDGMDMAFIALDTETLELQYAGANNPLYIVTSHSSIVTGKNKQFETNDQCLMTNDLLEICHTELASHESTELVEVVELVEVKADKMPIGIYQEMYPFKNNIIKVNKGDRLYIFSDGFSDQFGGENRRKFLPKRFKESLLQIAHLPMSEQRETLNNIFENWKGSNEQIDDVTVLGIKI
ncbi:MAG: SpoIIE family protein phosphatase [Bacteroidetes bacterium]|nr:SpoIIE family protein phosphatase [Bacteroidota bacterium]